MAGGAAFRAAPKTRLGVLRVRSTVIVLQAVEIGADELRDAQQVARESPKIGAAQELGIAATLVQQYSGDFTFRQDFEDDYQVPLCRP